MIFRLYTAYNKHDNIKNSRLKPQKNLKYYRKCSNNFAANLTVSWAYFELKTVGF